MTIVEQIHQEIDNAHLDSLNQPSSELSEKLLKIGFTRVPIVRDREQADVLKYYAYTYPFLKFLFEVELVRICAKYGLDIKPIENYIGEVPEKNADEIINAQPLKEDDHPENLLYADLTKDNSFFLTNGNGMWPGIWGSEWYKIPKRIYGVNFDSRFHADRYLQERGFTCKYLVNKVINYSEDRSGLFICAPHKMFSGENKKKSVVSVRVDDPIVFRYVRGGVQVLTKWGLEAKDTSLVNPKNN